MRQRGRFHVSLAIVLLLLLAGPMAGCLKDDDDNGDNGNGDDEVLANVGQDVYGKVGEAITFNASASSGKIETYWWDMDRGSATDELTKDLLGEAVSYTYQEAGVYIVTLTVEGAGDLNSTDTLLAHIDLVTSATASLSLTTINQTYEYTVKPEIEKILLTLTYPSSIIEVLPITVFLDMEVWTDEQTPVASTVAQLPDQGDTQTEELDVAPGLVIDDGGFRVVVRWAGPALGDVQFTLDVELIYHPS